MRVDLVTHRQEDERDRHTISKSDEFAGSIYLDIPRKKGAK